MQLEDLSGILVEQRAIASVYLKRYVIVDVYLPKNIPSPAQLNLLLVNDGQDLAEMNFSSLLNGLYQSGQIQPLFCVGIYAGKDRKNEYGTAKVPDYGGRGARAEMYDRFILEELLPFIHISYAIESFLQKAFCGFSLGGLKALDAVWNYPSVFSVAGVFSGSLWWRTRPLGEGYNDDTDRIMHQLIRKGKYQPGLRFYFTTGSLDETADRNGNGIIDSIDDTLALVEELKNKGYNDADVRYINYEDGRHDVATWGKATPGFLLWGWGKKQ
jgi:enterochelin esterase family protein